MKEKILEIIKQNQDKTNYKYLQKKLNIEESLLKQTLKELELEGSILKINNKYIPLPDNHYIGTISLTKNANKVIFYNGHIYPLNIKYINPVILNDTVSFTLNERKEAIITSIIDRALHNVTCIVKITGKKKIVECFYPGINIILDDAMLEFLNDGDIIQVYIGLNDIDNPTYKAIYKNKLGNISDPNIDELTIAANYGFDDYYSEEYLEELKNIPTEVTEKDIENRVDLRNLNFVTIDGIDAKDMDDAVYAEKIDNGYRVYVSISDVSHYVKFGTEIFNRAYEKGNTYYANNIVLHMLHYIIANGICSLNPGEDRLTKTVIIDIDDKGKILNYNIVKSVINSKKKMNYDDVDKLLVDNICIDEYLPFESLLKTLHETTTLLEYIAKNNQGKLDFPSDELNKTYDEQGNVTSVSPFEQTEAKKLIEYLMIAANQCVAAYLYWQQIPSIYRIHDIPDLKKINETLKTINDSDVNVKFKTLNNVNSPKAVQQILHKLSNLEEYPILASILLQDMQRAEYSIHNIGHYALGLEFYTHFTAPIRRLNDLLIHMILDILLESPELLYQKDFTKMENYLQEASKQASRMERQADAGERESSRLAILKSMQEHIGEEFEAIVTGINDVIIVKLNGIDSYVKYQYLSDNFNYDENKKRFYDKYNNQYLKLGSKVIVKIDNINLNTRQLYLNILGISNPKKLTK